MGRIFLGIVLLLMAAGCAFFFCATVFLHGFDEGLARIDSLKPDQILYGVGAIFFLIAGVSAFRQKKKQ